VLVQAIVFADVTTAVGMLAASPSLARERTVSCAARQTAEDSFFYEILHYTYEGGSALHMAAAAYQSAIDLIAKGADVCAKTQTRCGAAPLRQRRRARFPQMESVGPSGNHSNPYESRRRSKFIRQERRCPTAPCRSNALYRRRRSPPSGRCRRAC
jgi:hypothetical protein